MISMVLLLQWLEVDWTLCPYLPERVFLEEESLSPENVAMTSGCLVQCDRLIW